MSLGEKSVFIAEKLLKSFEVHQLEPGFYRFITDIVEAMNNLIQESHNQSEECITSKVSWRTQKI